METSSTIPVSEEWANFPIGVNEQAPPVSECFIVEDTPTPDNVLKYAIGEMETISIVGKKKSGEWYFASSFENPFEVMDALNRFMKIVQSHIEFDEPDED